MGAASLLLARFEDSGCVDLRRRQGVLYVDVYRFAGGGHTHVSLAHLALLPLLSFGLDADAGLHSQFLT